MYGATDDVAICANADVGDRYRQPQDNAVRRIAFYFGSEQNRSGGCRPYRRRRVAGTRVFGGLPPTPPQLPSTSKSVAYGRPSAARNDGPSTSGCTTGSVGCRVAEQRDHLTALDAVAAFTAIGLHVRVERVPPMSMPTKFPPTVTKSIFTAASTGRSRECCLSNRGDDTVGHGSVQCKRNNCCSSTRPCRTAQRRPNRLTGNDREAMTARSVAVEREHGRRCPDAFDGP